MTGAERIADLGEDGLVTSVVARYGPLPGYVLVGPGDDAAVLDLGAGAVVACTDTLVEGYDFRREWSTGRDVGIKTAAQNLADLAAMGARPLALLVSMAAPGGLPAKWAGELADGLDDECRRAGAAVVGGDVSQAREIVITGTALGVLTGPPVLRSGARSGDVVALAGSTGPSAAGLGLLRAGHGRATDPVLAALLRAHLAPRPPYPAGMAAAAAGAHAMIDISDGLLRDAARVAAASGVSIDLDPAALAPGPALRVAAGLLAAALPVDSLPMDALPAGADVALEWVLAGGEDHALLACFAPGRALPAEFRPIGRVLPAGAGGPQVLVAGVLPTGGTGWTHFD